MDLDSLIKAFEIMKTYDGFGMGMIVTVFLWSRFSFKPFKKDMRRDVKELNDKLKEHIKAETTSIEGVKKEVAQLRVVLVHLLTKIDPTNEDWKVLK